MQIHEIPTGTQAMDWQVPKEWRIDEAWIEDPTGRRIVDFAENNLHVVGYSEPVDRKMTLDELQEHLHSLPEQPDAIPYVTSYYKRRWGFCMPHTQRCRLPQGIYRVRIDSELFDGSLTYGECILPGQSKREVLISTYVCHPSMANNELSGPVIATALAEELAGWNQRRYTYRFVWIPETIGSLVYLSRHLEHLREYVVAGYVLTCLGDGRAWSFLRSRQANSLADRAAACVMAAREGEVREYTFLDRGSDERQYCAPGVDLPVASLMRSKYGTYPEYHTSLDNLELVSPESLQQSFEMVRQVIRLIEGNKTWKTNCLGEPQLGRRGLYPTLSAKDSCDGEVRDMMNILAYSDGSADLIDICTMGQIDPDVALAIVSRLADAELLTPLDSPD
jgi:aminopeptidase-like protein